MSVFWTISLVGADLSSTGDFMVDQRLEADPPLFACEGETLTNEL